MADEQRPEPSDSRTPVTPGEEVESAGAAPAAAATAAPAEPAAAPADAPGTFVPAPLPAPAPVGTGYTDRGVPTFDGVREKIETRYGTALGSHELAADTPEGRAAEEQYDARQKAAAERVAEIRKSMRSDDNG